MKKVILILLVFIGLASCNDNEQKSTINTDENQSVEKGIVSEEGLKLMTEKCFICHFPKPDPSKKGQMLAPPMLRVQEHYLPNYQSKEAFVEAIIAWVENPQEENTLMPGAIRKFHIMPKLVYEKDELKLIAETIFETDFGDMPKNMQNMHKSLSLNNGEKWEVKEETIIQIREVNKLLSTYDSEEIEDYNTLGKDVFDLAKVILMDKSYSEETFEALHSFFYSVESTIHNLIAETAVSKAEEEYNILVEKFENFDTFFESDN